MSSVQFRAVEAGALEIRCSMCECFYYSCNIIPRSRSRNPKRLMQMRGDKLHGTGADGMRLDGLLDLAAGVG
jgi:hypothetical protein